MVGSLVALYLTFAGAAGGDPQASIPERFQGLWAAEVATCDDFTSEGLVEILDHRLQFYERGADITAVHALEELSIRFDAVWWDVNDTDADERPIVRTTSTELSLSPDRSRLTLAVEGRSALFTRCPEA